MTDYADLYRTEHAGHRVTKEQLAIARTRIVELELAAQPVVAAPPPDGYIVSLLQQLRSPPHHACCECNDEVAADRPCRYCNGMEAHEARMRKAAEAIESLAAQPASADARIAAARRAALSEAGPCLHLADGEEPGECLMPEPCPNCGRYYVNDGNGVEAPRAAPSADPPGADRAVVVGALLEAVDRLMGRSYTNDNPSVHTWLGAMADRAVTELRKRRVFDQIRDVARAAVDRGVRVVTTPEVQREIDADLSPLGQRPGGSPENQGLVATLGAGAAGDLADTDLAFLLKHIADSSGFLRPLITEVRRHRATLARLEALARILELQQQQHGSPPIPRADVAAAIHDLLRGT